MHWAEFYFYSIGDNDSLGDRSNLFAALDEAERERYQKYKFDHSKYTYLKARHLLKTEISKKINVSLEDIRFSYNKNGKPYIAGRDDFHFNLSHTNDGIVFALSNNPVGVDIEMQHRRGQPWLNPEAYLNKTIAMHIEQYEQELEKIALFYRYWTLLESKVKLDGTTLYSIKERFNLPQEVVVDESFIEAENVYLAGQINSMQWALCFDKKPDKLTMFEYSASSSSFKPSKRWQNCIL